MMPRLKQFRVVGIFEIGMAPYDNSLALININDAQKLFQLGDAVTGISTKLREIDKAPDVARELQYKLPDGLYANDWTHQNSNYFKAVQMEKKMMFIILSLIVAVAAFNIVSTLVMAVTDKQSDIAILRMLGASPRSIMKIFIVQGVVIGLIGTLAGSVCGVLLALNLNVVVPFIEPVRRAIPRQRCVLHQRTALRFALHRSIHGFRTIIFNQLVSHPVSELARIENSTCGGAAL